MATKAKSFGSTQNENPIGGRTARKGPVDASHLDALVQKAQKAIKRIAAVRTMLLKHDVELPAIEIDGASQGERGVTALLKFSINLEKAVALRSDSQ